VDDSIQGNERELMPIAYTPPADSAELATLPVSKGDFCRRRSQM
jgi:hypothetical protein